jgi:hypothetical protein
VTFQKPCEDCGHPFDYGMGEEWKRLCISCWKKKAGSRRSDPPVSSLAMAGLQEQIELLRSMNKKLLAENAILKLAVDQLRRNQDLKRSAAPSLSKEQLTKFLRFAHPDRHKGCETANELTQWLITERSRVT